MLFQPCTSTINILKLVEILKRASTDDGVLGRLKLVEILKCASTDDGVLG
jgi:hypothetical protein